MLNIFLTVEFFIIPLNVTSLYSDTYCKYLEIVWYFWDLDFYPKANLSLLLRQYSIDYFFQYSVYWESSQSGWWNMNYSWTVWVGIVPLILSGDVSLAFSSHTYIFQNSFTCLQRDLGSALWRSLLWTLHLWSVAAWPPPSLSCVSLTQGSCHCGATSGTPIMLHG